MKRVIPGIVMVLVMVTAAPAAFGQDLFKIFRSNYAASRGQALYANGKYEQAIVMLKEAVAIRPEHGRASYYLALAYQNAHKRDQAIAVLDAYLGLIEKSKDWIGAADREYSEKCRELLRYIDTGMSREAKR